MPLTSPVMHTTQCLLAPLTWHVPNASPHWGLQFCFPLRLSSTEIAACFHNPFRSWQINGGGNGWGFLLAWRIFSSVRRRKVSKWANVFSPKVLYLGSGLPVAGVERKQLPSLDSASNTPVSSGKQVHPTLLLPPLFATLTGYVIRIWDLEVSTTGWIYFPVAEHTQAGISGIACHNLQCQCANVMWQFVCLCFPSLPSFVSGEKQLFI